MMWHFPQLGPQEPREESKLDNFFDDQLPAVALIRESLQNSRDAGQSVNEPVTVIFSFLDVPLNVVKEYLHTKHGSLLEHIKATGRSYDSPNVPCLLIEDFNTRGLDGPTDHMQAQATGNFIGFWWEQGLSSKQKGSGGSHGVGKTKLSTSSELRAFFALTKRADDKKTFLIGFCLLPYHAIHDDQFRGYARFGNADDHDHLHPLTDEAPEDARIIDQFRHDFGLSRTDEPGLSIIVPAVNDEITPQGIKDAVLSDFFMPVIEGRIVVEINCDGDTEPLRINRQFLENWHADFTPSRANIEEQQQHALIGVALNLDKIGLFYADPASGVGKDHNIKIDSQVFPDADIEKMQAAFDCGDVVGAQIQVLIEPSPDNPDVKESVLAPLRLYIQQQEGNDLRASAFIRGSIIVRSERPKIAQPYTVAILDARNNDLSEYLKWAEDPGHQKWQYKRLKDQNRYRSDSALRIVLNALKELCSLLSGVEEEKEMKGVAADIFSIVEPKPKEKKGDQPVSKPDPIVPNAIPFALQKISGGFKLIPGKDLSSLAEDGELTLPFRVRTLVGYKVFIGNSVKKYNPLDFNLADSEFSINTTGANLITRDHNCLEIEITDKKFELSVTGFDPERDIEVRATLASMENA